MSVARSKGLLYADVWTPRFSSSAAMGRPHLIRLRKGAGAVGSSTRAQKTSDASLVRGGL